MEHFVLSFIFYHQFHFYREKHSCFDEIYSWVQALQQYLVNIWRGVVSKTSEWCGRYELIKAEKTLLLGITILIKETIVSISLQLSLYKCSCLSSLEKVYHRLFGQVFICVLNFESITRTSGCLTLCLVWACVCLFRMFLCRSTLSSESGKTVVIEKLAVWSMCCLC